MLCLKTLLDSFQHSKEVVEVDEWEAVACVLLLLDVTTYAYLKGLKLCPKCLFWAGILNTLGLILKNRSSLNFAYTCSYVWDLPKEAAKRSRPAEHSANF